MNLDRDAIASWFYGNMFDGQRGGEVTANIDRLVQEMVNVVGFMLEDLAREILGDR